MAIGEYLKQNHKIYGIHIEGNKGCYVDSQGFIKPLFCSDDSVILDGVPFSELEKSRIQDNIHMPRSINNVINKCWICDGWQEMKFEWLDSKIF